MPTDPSLETRLFGAFAARPRPSAEQMLRPAAAREGERLRELLARKAPSELTASDLRIEVEGNLWMIGPDAFDYFLPAFMYGALESYSTVSVFVSELVGALTEPSRTDVEDAVGRVPPPLRELAGTLLDEQLEWFDSGTPSAIFRERVAGLTPGEGAAVLGFFDALRSTHGADFPFGELDLAIDRYWSRYRVS